MENLLNWTRDSHNKLMFIERIEKYALFKNPQVTARYVKATHVWRRVQQTEGQITSSPLLTALCSVCKCRLCMLYAQMHCLCMLSACIEPESE